LRVRDHTHLRELLLNTIFQIPGVQRTETFLSLADAEPDNFAEALLDQMSQLAQPGQRARSGDKARGNQP
jgi:Lrp/AsnC family transcriptional regulator for asnA, asnC and gidA